MKSNDRDSCFFCKTFGRLAIVPVLLFFLLGNTPAAQPKSPRNRKELQHQLDTLWGITWTSVPLRQALSSLTEQTGVSILLSRQIDPDQTIDFSIQEKSLFEGLQALANQHGWGVSLIETVVYIGPSRVTEDLATLVAIKNEKIHSLSRKIRNRLLRQKRWQWNDLTTPAELLAQLAKEENIQFVGAQKIPHDLWPAAKLPPLGFAERLSLLLVGFEMTFEFTDSGKTVRLIPMPERVYMQRNYPVGRNGKQIFEQLKSALPAVQFRLYADHLEARGRIEDHENIEKLLQDKPITRKKRMVQGERRYSLNQVKNEPVESLFKAIAAQLGKKIRFEDLSVEKLQERVTLGRVKDATFDQLLQAVLKPVQLSYRLEGEEIHVISATKEE